MADSEAASFPALSTFRALPREGDVIFAVGDQLVRFTRVEDGQQVGWAITTPDPGYQGFLFELSTTVLGEAATESFWAYRFEHKIEAGPASGAGPIPVTVVEFRNFFLARPLPDKRRYRSKMSDRAP